LSQLLSLLALPLSNTAQMQVVGAAEVVERLLYPRMVQPTVFLGCCGKTPAAGPMKSISSE